MLISMFQCFNVHLDDNNNNHESVMDADDSMSTGCLIPSGVVRLKMPLGRHSNTSSNRNTNINTTLNTTSGVVRTKLSFARRSNTTRNQQRLTTGKIYSALFGINSQKVSQDICSKQIATRQKMRKGLCRKSCNTVMERAKDQKPWFGELIL